MRLDLTHASYRVLQRAADLRLPLASSEISAPRLLIALFEEEECRAADWLAEAGLSLERFQTEFNLDGSQAVLRSPISAPPFPVGSYGIAPGSVREPLRSGSSQVEATSVQDNVPSVTNPDPEPKAPPEDRHGKHAKHGIRQEADEWTASSADFGKQTYSLYQDDLIDAADSGPRIPAQFYLEDQPVAVGRLSRALESTLEILGNHFGKRGRERQRIPTFGGGIATISTLGGGLVSHPLATEHLLLAATFDRGDVGRWLRDHGFETTTLLERIERLEANKEPAGFEMPLEPQAVDHDDFDKLFAGEDGHAEVRNNRNQIEPRNVYRLLDAAANRAREALRVIEDFARFLSDDPSLTRRLKDFRHELRETLAPLRETLRLEARDTVQDVGTGIEGGGEFCRASLDDVLSANFARLQESLRSLEEFSKLEHPDMARRLEKLRYRSYTLHKEVFAAKVETEEDVTLGAHAGTDVPASLEDAKLYVLLDCRKDEGEFVKLVRALIDGGVDVIQLRDKSADDRTILARSRLLHTLIAEADRPVFFMMNDRPDLAKLGGADGVHVGQEELPVAEVRKIVGPGLLIGVSTHDLDQARRAVGDGADYIGCGPVFESSTKSFGDRYDELPGLDFLREVAREIAIPAFAIGGISVGNLVDVLATGFCRIAVGAAVTGAENPGAAAKELKRRLADVPKSQESGS